MSKISNVTMHIKIHHLYYYTERTLEKITTLNEKLDVLIVSQKSF